MRIKGVKAAEKIGRRTKQDFVEHIKSHKSTFIVYLVLRVLVVAIGIRAFFSGNYEHVMLCILSLVLFMIPAFVTKNFGIELPSTLEIIVLLFIFAAEILGELSCFYIKFAHWDTMLHTVNGFLCAAIGFSLVDVFNRTAKFKFRLSPFFLAFFAFCFSMTVGVLWEFFEFSGDFFLNMDMQKDFVVHSVTSVAFDSTKTNTAVTINDIKDTILVTSNGETALSSFGIHGYLDIGIIDTMKDLMVNFVGAVVFSVIGFFYVKSRGKNKFAERFIPTLIEDNGSSSESKESSKSISQNKNTAKDKPADNQTDNPKSSSDPKINS